VLTVEDVTEALRQVYDPELGLDIVELGLLYDVRISGGDVTVRYSLTSIGCPAGPLIQEQIKEAVLELPAVEKLDLELTWDPPWTPERLSEDAKLLLGFGY
jgi:metal-sulfur cluster biosynthetic enzyme